MGRGAGTLQLKHSFNALHHCLVKKGTGHPSCSTTLLGSKRAAEPLECPPHRQVKWALGLLQHTSTLLGVGEKWDSFRAPMPQ